MAKHKLACPICSGTKFTEGVLGTRRPSTVMFKVSTSWVTSDYTEVAAHMCQTCGFVLLLGAIGDSPGFYDA